MGSGIRFILKNLKPYKIRISLAVIFSLVSSLALVLLPGSLKTIASYIETNLKGNLSFDDVKGSILFFAAALILYFVCNLLQGILMSDSTVRLGSDLRRRIDEKIDSLTLSYIDKQSEGDLQSRMINDVDTLTTSLSTSIGSAASNLLLVVFCLVLMFRTNVAMSVALLVSTMIGFAFSSIAISISQPEFVKQQGQLGALYGLVNETLNGHLVVKAFNCEDDVREQFNDKNNELYKSSMMSRFLSDLMQPLTVLSSNLSYIAVCITGAVLRVKHGSAFSIGDIVAFILYANLFTSPISGLIQTASALQPSAACADRIAELLEGPDMERKAEKPEKPARIRGDVSFRNVSFGYVEGQTILKDLSAEVKQGQKIAIVGKTGAGKSTMVNLLMRFYDVRSGEICLDGIPITEYTDEELHNAIGMVLQDVWTFEGTIKENILYGREDVSDGELDRVLKATGLSWLISTLPEGVNTVLSEQSGISAGQLQLMTIARAMIRNTPVLILDEATSNVDTRTEKLIQEAIDNLTKGRTSFVIAHRLSTIQNADQIFVMESGNVKEIGSHEELLKKGGLYAEIYNSQFEKDDEE
ncbi:MAG: ABC transporter ATP-binding protein/permease [Lachnospiraceae bacterium]|nr:ABC transporter ATP-binding protein/permease [Lachnospiraceae bacterium]